MAGWRVGIDTGGTYTDLVAIRGDDRRVTKVPSTPPHFEHGILAAVEAAAIAVPEIDIIAHGTTVATNALITGTGAPTALITTAGFRDVLQLGRHNRGEPYDILWDPPAPLVPRRHRYEVRERLDWAGGVVEPLDEAAVRTVARRAADAGIASFAICFLHSYVNPEHEELAHRILAEALPESFVCHSAELLREPPEFERTSTTVINAYLMPIVSAYLTALSARLRGAGFRGQLAVMHSGGGLLTVESAARYPARLVTSGPAAGAKAAEGVAGGGIPVSGSPAATVVVAEEVARLEGLDALISLDIGGTSADIAVVRDGRARLVTEYSPQFGQPIRFPAIDLVTIGAGGGSIAWVDAGDLPHVGPQSAGANPGPAAYLAGGTDATVTDANIVLGRLGAGVALAGGIHLDSAAAREAVGRFAERLGLSLEAAALGIIDLCNHNMARSIRVVTVNRGLDPRDFTLVPFGGAGPLHAGELAEILGIRRIVVPLLPGVTSGLGCLFVDLTHDVSEAMIVPLDAVVPERLEAVFERLEADVRRRLEEDGVRADEQRIARALDLRYLGQVRGLTIEQPRDTLGGDVRAALRDRFFVEYERQFHSYTQDIAVEVAALRVHGGRVFERPTLPFRAGQSELRATDREVVTASGPVTARVIERSRLPVGTRLAGPLVLPQPDSTTWVPPAWQVEVDPAGNLVMTYRGDVGR
ncbi:MAG TPA: hydantoinase/oxoprolinase family protein [Candidatus Dormibacteraeota bacterium]|nr:hydantoinase/oxoprolinase family protein [Candidatus Dormibacteraeota bacterium]